MKYELEIAKKMHIPIRCYDERLDRITPDTLSIDDRVDAEFLAELKGATLVEEVGVVLRLDARQFASVILHQQGLDLGGLALIALGGHDGADLLDGDLLTAACTALPP